MRAGRLLSILLLLQVHRRLTARELARRMEVSERTILRDMDALSGSGVPVMAERGAGGGWSLLDQTKLTGLDAAEIQSLFLSQPGRLLADLGLKQDAETASIKLLASLPAAARRQADFARRRVLIDTRGWRDTSEAISCLPVLLDAIWTQRQVRFLYRREGCEPGERCGNPLGLVAKGSVWYLVADIDGETKTYRVSRMQEATVLDQSATYSATFDLAAYWERSAVEFRDKLPRFYATFLAHQSAMRWIRYRGWRLEEERAEGDHVRVRIRFDIEEEALHFALSFGAGVEVIEPVELRAKVVQAAQGLIERYAPL
jgi:predicted DNA-binding transcriptional regulator YafY